MRDETRLQTDAEVKSLIRLRWDNSLLTMIEKLGLEQVRGRRTKAALVTASARRCLKIAYFD
jgi:hypothetical protein